MPVEDQVVQIYAATNGFLDRIVVAKVDRFLSGLTAGVRANEPELLETIASGDWSDETQEGVHDAVERVCRGLRLRPRRGGPPARGRRHRTGAGPSGRSDGDSGSGAGTEQSEQEEAVTA